MNKIQFLKGLGGKTVSLTNLLSNGNFANTTGWTYTGGALSVVSNVATYICAQANAVLITPMALINTHKYYACSWIKSSSASVGNRVTDSVSYGLSAYSAGSNAFEFISLLYTAIRTGTGGYAAVYDTRTSSWNYVYAKYCTAIDLTAAFGAGNEPTKAQMDTLMAQFENNWLNGTQTAFYNW